jgi:hypothetical protein
MVESQSEYSLTRAETALSLVDDSIPELPIELLKLDQTVYCLAWGNSFEKP